MEIKVGDIVEYCGQQCRVLSLINESNNNRLHLFGSFSSSGVWVYESDVKLVESVELPTLNVGDTVFVDDVPSYEKTVSNGVWVHRMDKFIGETFKVKRFINYEEYGTLVKLDDLWFRTYHLTKVSDYDMI